MKRIILFLALIAVPVFGAAEKTETKVVEPSTKDAFFSFVLEKAKTYSEKIEVGISKAVDVAQEEIPLVVKEFLTWRAWQHGIMGALQFMGVCVFGYLIYLLLEPTVIDSSDGVSIAIAIFVFAVALFIGHFAVQNGLGLVKINVAPRIYLIEEVLNFVKK